MRHLFTPQISLYVAASAGFVHLFCCGLPLLLSLGSLTATFGMTSSDWHTAFRPYEMPLLVISGALLLLTGLVHWIAYRIDCRTDGECHHAPCAPKKDYARIIFAGACALYLVNSAILLLTH